MDLEYGYCFLCLIVASASYATDIEAAGIWVFDPCAVMSVYCVESGLQHQDEGYVIQRVPTTLFIRTIMVVLY